MIKICTQTWGALTLFCFSIVNAHGNIIDIDSIANNNLGNAVSISFAPGRYDVTPIGTSNGGAYDAWNWNFGIVADCDGSGANCRKGWINNYIVKVDGAPEQRISDGIKYLDPLLALDNALGTSFTLTAETNVSFYIPDLVPLDNEGGISLDVTAVPVPGAAWLFGTGILGLWRFRGNNPTEAA